MQVLEVHALTVSFEGLFDGVHLEIIGKYTAVQEPFSGRFLDS